MVTKYLSTQGLDDLGSKEQLRLLDAVDSLRSQGISQHVSLPQIIVCGDQSSGKSSVLEAISGVSFPVQANTGTRFPTELILRRTNLVSVRVSIVPHHSRSDGEKNSLSGFREELENFQELPTLIDNAKAAMGIMTLGKAFSKDILRIEISGPDRPHLTIVDLPGLIHSENKHQSRDDVQLITDVVKEYMKEERSVILAVISAKNDYPNQIVLNLARTADPSGLRTLGVITKPDCLKSGSPSESQYIALARNKEVEFRHGWHVLRNRDTDADEWDLSERDAHEQLFFSTGSWSSLQASQLGIKALRERLSKLLLHQIASELPNLKDEITAKLADCEVALKRLGEPRSTTQEQRTYLIQVSLQFQTLLKAAVDGTYNDPFFGKSSTTRDDQKRIRAVIQKRSMAFAKELEQNGGLYKIENVARDGLKVKKVMDRETYIDRIVDMMNRTRGRELPAMFNPLIVTDLFQEQSSPWRLITEAHAKSVWAETRAFMRALVGHVADMSTAQNILDNIVEPHMDLILANLYQKVADLIKPLQDGHPITYSRNFEKSLQSARLEKRRSRLEEILSKFYKHELEHKNAFLVKTLLDHLVSQEEHDMTRVAASEALDCSEVYYTIALERFIDDVAVEVVETCLLVELSSIFSPLTVVNMRQNEVSRIAGESEESCEARKRFENNIKTLKAGAETCREFAGFRVVGLHDHKSRKSDAVEADHAANEAMTQDTDEAVAEEANEAQVDVETAAPPLDSGPVLTENDEFMVSGLRGKKLKKKVKKMQRAIEEQEPQPVPEPDEMPEPEVPTNSDWL